MNQLIIAPPIGETPQIAITESGQQLKEILLKGSASVIEIHESNTRDAALTIAGNIKAHIAAVEKTRKEIKEPFFRTGQAIDKAAADHVAELEKELKRLSGLIGEFEAARRREEEARQRALAEEQARAAREAEKARLEALRIAEEARRKEEAAAAKGRKLSDIKQQEFIEAQLDADERRLEIEAEQARLAAEAAARAIAAQQAKPEGGALKTEIDITITDIHALYAACRQAVRMEPDKAFIKTMFKAGVRYPGVSYTERQVFATRSR